MRDYDIGIASQAAGQLGHFGPLSGRRQRGARPSLASFASSAKFGTSTPAGPITAAGSVVEGAGAGFSTTIAPAEALHRGGHRGERNLQLHNYRVGTFQPGRLDLIRGSGGR